MFITPHFYSRKFRLFNPSILRGKLGWRTAVYLPFLLILLTQSPISIQAGYLIRQETAIVTDTDPWGQIAQLLASDGAKDDYCGRPVAISGETVLVGATGDDDNGDSSGSVYLFDKRTGWSDGSSNQMVKLTPADGVENDGFGTSVAIIGDTVVVGAPDGYGTSPGSVYVFEKGLGWSDGSNNQVAKLMAGDAANGDSFGKSIAISGETILVGATEDDDNGDGSGSVYVFDKETGWSNGSSNQTAKLIADDGAVGDSFGKSVAISEEVVVIGADRDDDKGNESGSVYVFEKGLGWSDGIGNQTAKLVANDGVSENNFGISVAVYGETVVVGKEDDFEDDFPSTGSVYIFEKGVGWSNGSGNQTAKLIAEDGALNDYFGKSVAIYEDTMVIGAMGDDDNGLQSGSAYVFEKGTGWSDGSSNQIAKLIAEDGSVGDYFGESVAISGDLVVVGAFLDDGNSDNSGSVYLFAPVIQYFLPIVFYSVSD